MTELSGSESAVPLRHAEAVMGTVVSFDIRDAGTGPRRR